MRLIFSVFVIFYSYITVAEEIVLTELQAQNLGIQLGHLVALESVPLLTAPAKITIPPKNDYIVSTLQAGLLQEIKVSIGDKVKKGQVLATINSPQLLELQQQYLNALNALQLAKADFNRDKKLLSEGIITERRWKTTQAQHKILLSQVNQSKQLLVLSGFSKAAMQQLITHNRLNSQLTVIAPISGVILERFVRSGAPINALEPLFRLANIEQLWLDISIPQQRMQRLQLGDKVVLENSEYTADIFFLSQQVNADNQTVLARAKLEAKTDSLRIGQIIRVQINQTHHKNTFSVPNRAVASFDNKSHIFIKTATGFKIQVVKVLGKSKGQTNISTDLPAKTMIATKGAVALKAHFLGLGGDE